MDFLLNSSAAGEKGKNPDPLHQVLIAQLVTEQYGETFEIHRKNTCLFLQTIHRFRCTKLYCLQRQQKWISPSRIIWTEILARHVRKNTGFKPGKCRFLSIACTEFIYYITVQIVQYCKLAQNSIVCPQVDRERYHTLAPSSESLTTAVYNYCYYYFVCMWKYIAQ